MSASATSTASAMEIPTAMAPPPATLHAKPALYPVYLVLCLFGALFTLIFLTNQVSVWKQALVQTALHGVEYRLAAGVAFVLAATVVFAGHWRRVRPPPLPAYLRWNHGVLLGFLLAFGGVAMWVADFPERMLTFIDSFMLQGIYVGACCVVATIAYGTLFRPLAQATDTDLEPYQQVVARLRDSYDFVMGVSRPDDWKTAQHGPREWVILKEPSLWTNIFAFGGIGSGKTSALAFPFLTQAMGKYPGNPHLQPSVMLLDLKGDNAEKVHGFARRLGREQDYVVIRPGNSLRDASGKDIIPPRLFRTWNPVGGTEPADTRATFLLDGLNAADQSSSKNASNEYFERVEREFLIAAIQMFDAVKGHGKVTLHDLYLFCFDADYRDAIANSPEVAGTTAKKYFEKALEVLDDDHKTQLVSGLRAKLAPIAQPTMQATFCANGEGETEEFAGFVETIVNKPGVVVFSVSEGEFGREIARLLGVMFLRYFHAALLKRNSTSFVAQNGNTQRLVVQMTDEASAYMNPGVGDFTAVSRQARTCSYFLTQSLAQVPERYRDVVEGNFRTKFLLSVNDTLTLQRMEFLFGQTREVKTSVSTSQNLNDVKHGILTQHVSGKSQGLSVSTSTNEELRPRFAASELIHMLGGRAVMQLYDGETQRTTEARAIEATPYFKLKYHLFHPFEHPHIRCRHHKGREHHHFAVDNDGALCEACGLRLTTEEHADVLAYRHAFEHLLS